MPCNLTSSMLLLVLESDLDHCRAAVNITSFGKADFRCVDRDEQATAVLTEEVIGRVEFIKHRTSKLPAEAAKDTNGLFGARDLTKEGLTVMDDATRRRFKLRGLVEAAF